MVRGETKGLNSPASPRVKSTAEPVDPINLAQAWAPSAGFGSPALARSSLELRPAAPKIGWAHSRYPPNSIRHADVTCCPRKSYIASVCFAYAGFAPLLPHLA
jgi:hypothetical protein